MRLTIVAGLILGVALAVQSALGAHARARAGHAVRAGSVQESAPWYVAMSAGHGAGTRGNRARRLREADTIGSS